MQCPIDKIDLVMSDRQGIEIDYCPQCRGVWLDRGELDKIIERSGTTVVGSSQTQPAIDHRQFDTSPQKRNYADHDSSYGDRGYHHKKHKKENFLGDLFDF